MPPHFDLNDLLLIGMSPKQICEASDRVPTITSETIALETQQKLTIVNGEDFPKLHPDAWLPMLAEVRDALHVRLPSPDPWILGALLPMISHIVGRRVETNLGGKHILAMYSLLVGASNIGKSAILDYIHNELTPQVDQALRPFGTTINKMGYMASAEGLGKIFRDEFRDDYRGFSIQHEFSTQLQKAKSEGGGPIIQSLCDMWYGSFQSSTSKMHEWNLAGKHLAIAAASTKVWIHQHVRKPDLQGGFANRFMYFVGCKEQARIMDFIFNPDQGVIDKFIKALVDMEKRLGRHQGMTSNPCRITTLHEANALWKVFKKGNLDSVDPNDEIQVALVARVQDHVARVAALYCLLEGTQGITAQQMQRAILLGDYLNQTALWMYKDYDANPKVEAQNWIIKQLQANANKMNKRDLHRHAPRKYSEVLSLAITELIRQGVMTDEKDGRKAYWVLTEGSDLAILNSADLETEEVPVEAAEAV